MILSNRELGVPILRNEQTMHGLISKFASKTSQAMPVERMVLTLCIPQGIMSGRAEDLADTMVNYT